MAKSSRNIITQTYRGHVGKQFVIKWYSNKSVISKMPVFTKPWSSGQKEYREKFRKTAKQASRLARDPAVQAMYASRIKPGITVYNLVLQDVLKGIEINLTR